MARPNTIVIVGPGAMGSLLASFLASRSHRVVLLDKDEQRAAFLTRHGIRIEDPPDLRVLRVRTTADVREVGRADAVCLCVKSYDTEAALRHARPAIGPATWIASLQNGLGNLEHVAALAPGSPAMAAVTSHGATAVATGHALHAGRGPTLVAPCRAAEADSARSFAGLLDEAGMEASFHPDIQAVLWSKLVVNAAINPVTAIHDLPNGGLVADRALFDLAAAAAREAERVASAKGIRLLYPDGAAEVAAVCRRTAANLSSMLQDVRRGRRTEIDAINGAIVREGQALGLDTAVNAELVRLVRARETAVAGPRRGEAPSV